MADDEEMEEKKVVKPPEPVYYKVFLNDMNSWFSRFIIENMRSDLKKDLLINYSFMGTVQSNERRLPDLFTPEIIKMDYNDHYKAKLFENDIFIFNMHDANFNDIDYIIKGLKAKKKVEKKRKKKEKKKGKEKKRKKKKKKKKMKKEKNRKVKRKNTNPQKRRREGRVMPKKKKKKKKKKKEKKVKKAESQKSQKKYCILKKKTL